MERRKKGERVQRIRERERERVVEEGRLKLEGAEQRRETEVMAALQR